MKTTVLTCDDCLPNIVPAVARTMVRGTMIGVMSRDTCAAHTQRLVTTLSQLFPGTPQPGRKNAKVTGPQLPIRQLKTQRVPLTSNGNADTGTAAREQVLAAFAQPTSLVAVVRSTGMSKGQLYHYVRDMVSDGQLRPLIRPGQKRARQYVVSTSPVTTVTQAAHRAASAGREGTALPRGDKGRKRVSPERYDMIVAYFREHAGQPIRQKEIREAILKEHGHRIDTSAVSAVVRSLADDGVLRRIGNNARDPYIYGKMRAGSQVPVRQKHDS